MWWISIALGVLAALINWPIEERAVVKVAVAGGRRSDLRTELTQ
jgi:hypothetical protein